ncbi:septum site-determining protein MinC [Chamaesiphon minutus]|uniref:Probable septum site-determining protein MinC n=1 Tax=Chamaesiphon minutus (strain ATCC 27169 / PCC 6605) TaxID=1173020 RepID=K9UNI2_CHAP6|nr:septum site-determining protein MinC [Chamaesiphon minutus]AFY95749.1 septum formation inhibitor [Chamaesiphon minutus PCC 6605]
MNADSSSTLSILNTQGKADPEPVKPSEQPKLQIRLKNEDGVVKLILPTVAETSASASWSDLWEQLQQRLQAGKRFWQPLSVVHLIAQDRLLDARQLQSISDALTDVALQLQLVATSRRQTAVAAATAGYCVTQQSTIAPLFPQPIEDAPPLIAEPLYLQMTVRSGIDIRHQGTVIIMGDVNPGGEIYAAGDIIVWGRLRGIAHAGYPNNPQCLIMALQMEPTQLRIADRVARAPETPPPQFDPEIAYVTPQGIRIARAVDIRTTPYLRELALPGSKRSEDT